ncbi:MAG: hypothetical protein DMF04_05935 [Verrucomicrobia bacterium]|nr:MAG: hypothetical protein DMF04_05935 [Verrucomicrobiota bacterium]
MWFWASTVTECGIAFSQRPATSATVKVYRGDSQNADADYSKSPLRLLNGKEHADKTGCEQH